MSRTTLLERIEKLEDRVCATSLSREELVEIAASLRAEGRDEGHVLDVLLKTDPFRFRREAISPREYSIHDSGFFRLPDKWAAQHPDRFVRLLGQAEEGTVCVATHEQESTRLPLAIPDDFDWRALDPLVLAKLAVLSWSPSPWQDWWALPANLRREKGLLQHYVDAACEAADEFEARHGTTETEAVRAELRRRIDWVRANPEEPPNLPWQTNGSWGTA